MNDILERVLNIQNSINTQERNDFINDYIPLSSRMFQRRLGVM